MTEIPVTEYLGEKHVWWADMKKIPVKSYRQKRKCAHDWARITDTHDSWAYVCLKCGGRAR